MRMRRKAALLLLVLAGCRTGSDGDPWAHLYSAEDDALGDDDVTDDDAPDADEDRSDDDASDDDVSDDDAPSAPTDDDVTPVPVNDDDVADDDTAADDDVPEPMGDDAADDDTAADDDVPDPMGDDDGADDDVSEPQCEPSNEVCDDADNDCDEYVDEGFVCPPEPGVVGAVPYEGGVYFEGTTVPGSASATALQRFWPSVADSYIDGFDSYDDRFKIRRSDNQLFFTNREELHGAIDGVVPIEPCSTAPTSWDFDAEGVLAYSCGFGLFRAGEELATDGGIFGVTDDGRVVGGTSEFGWGHWQDGVFTPADFDFGTAFLRGYPPVFHGNIGVVPLLVDDAEIAVLKFDEESHWSLMRRMPVVEEQLGAHALAIPDGTIFMQQWDPDGNQQLRIVAYLPDGSEVVAWHESDGGAVQEVFSLFPGPLDPADILHGRDTATR